MMQILKKGQKVVYVDRRDDRHEAVVKVPNTKKQPGYCTVTINDDVGEGERDVHVSVLSLENPVGAAGDDEGE